ncbi:MAG: PilZ domain-containing protein [Acidobacteriota bacterium]
MKPLTESRREERFEGGCPVQVSILGEAETKLAGQLSDFSAGGLRLLVERPVPEGAAVKVEFGETLLLGEVSYCRPAEGGYAVGLELEHSLACTEELVRLARELNNSR